MSVQSDHHYGFHDAKNVEEPSEESPNKGNRDWLDGSFEGGNKIGIPGVRTQAWDRMGKAEGYELFQNGIEASDINQGQLGDCYFLAALAALAEDQGFIEAMVLDKGYRTFGVRLFHWGRPIIQWVDDRFPVDHGKPVFSHSAEKELWVLLMEKAYAKTYGTYGNIASGLPSDALTDLTGSPVTSMETVYAWNGQIWEDMTKNTGSSGACVSCASISGSPIRRLLTFGLERYFWRLLRMLYVCLHRVPYVSCVLDLFYCIYTYIRFAIFWLAGTIDGLCGGCFTAIHVLLCTTFVGLVPGHAYSVLEVKGEGLTKLVKLRNPWGKTEWQGFYGDNSWCWSLRSGLAEDLGIVHEDDGSFWMHLNDFCCYFDRVDTCHMLPEVKSKRVTGKINSLQTCILMSVTEEDTELCVQINQPRNGQRREHMLNWRLRLVPSGPKIDDADMGLGNNLYAASEVFNQDCQLATGFVMLKPAKYAILIDCHSSDKPDVNRDGGVPLSVVVTSKNCERIQFEIPQFKVDASSEV